jgi:hypothetical protein
MNVKSPNNIIKWQMAFNLAFKWLKRTYHHSHLVSASKQSSGFYAEVLGCERRVTLAKDSVVTADFERV